MFVTSTEEHGECKEGEVETCQQPSVSKHRNELYLPPEMLLDYIYPMTFNKKTFKLLSEDFRKFHIVHPLYMAQFLAHYTGWDELKDLPLDDELFELFRIKDIMRDRLHLIFAKGSVIWPRSKPTINLVNRIVFKDPLLSHEYKCTYFNNLAERFIEHKEISTLDYLIEVVDKDILESLSLSFGYLLFGQPGISANSALRFCRFIGLRSTYLLVDIFLTPMEGESFEAALSLAKELLSEQDFGIGMLHRMLYYMIEEVSTWNPHSFFTHATELVYKNNTRLLDLIEAQTQRNPDTRSLVLYVRVIYSIRLGFRQRSEIVAGIHEEVVTNVVEPISDVIDELIADIVALGPFSKSARFPKSEDDIFPIISAVIYAQNRMLFSKLWQRIPETSDVTQYSEISQMHIVNMISSQHGSWMNAGCLKPMVQLCKSTIEDYPGKWIEDVNPWCRLAVLAEMNDLTEFESLMTKFDPRYRGFEYTLLYIINVENPLPFVKSVLLNIADRRKMSHPLGSLKFLRCLLLEWSDDNAIIQLLDGIIIKPDADFFEALLDDQALAHSFQYGGGGTFLRGKIRLDRHSFSGKCFERIVELLEILRVPVNIDTAFNAHYTRTNWSAAKLRHKGTTLSLTELDSYAQAPGFLAALALAYSGMFIEKTFIGKPQVTFEMLNPLCFPTFSLLRQWYICDMNSFISLADWRIVLAFFGAKPSEFLWRRVKDSFTYPCTIEYSLKQHFCSQKMLFEFLSEERQRVFERDVYPVLNDDSDF